VAAEVTAMRRPMASEQTMVHAESAVEVIDAKQLAARLRLPVSWVMEATRSRAIDPIPCLRFGKYVRFRWGSRELAAWIERRASGKQGDE
jgi:hypothetical protein